MACAPALREKCPSEKVPYREKFGPCLVKKEFDEEGKAKVAAVKVDLQFTGAGNGIFPEMVILEFKNKGTVSFTDSYTDDNGYWHLGGTAYLTEDDILEAVTFTIFDVPNNIVYRRKVEGMSTQISAQETKEVGFNTEPNVYDVMSNETVQADSPQNPLAITIYGETEGVEGIQAYHFGARMYDPEVAVWGSTDPVDQLWNSYGYSTNPVNTIDPDGRSILGAVVKAGTWYGGNALRYGSANPADWDWSDPMLWINTGAAAVSMGFEIGDAVSTYRHQQYYKPQLRASNYDLLPEKVVKPMFASSGDAFDFPYELSNVEPPEPMAFESDYIDIARGMEMDKVAYGFRTVSISQVAFIGGGVAGYTLGPAAQVALTYAGPKISVAVTWSAATGTLVAERTGNVLLQARAQLQLLFARHPQIYRDLGQLGAFLKGYFTAPSQTTNVYETVGTGAAILDQMMHK